MSLARALTAILPQRALERTRFLDPETYELAQQCRKRRKHREAERDIKH